MASAGGLLLGTQTVFNVLIAMLFRVVVTLLYAVLGKSKAFYVLSGPLHLLLHALPSVLSLVKQFIRFLAVALPGMIFTALTAGLFASVFEKTLLLTKRVYERS